MHIHQKSNVSITSLSFDHTRKSLACGTSNGDVYLYSVGRESVVSKWSVPVTSNSENESKYVENITFFPMSSSVIAFTSSSLDRGSICIVDSRAKKSRVLQPYVHGSRIRSLKFSPNGSWILAGDNSGGVKLWDVKTTNLLFQMFHYEKNVLSNREEHRPHILDVSFHPSFYVSGVLDSFGMCSFWNVDTEAPDGYQKVCHTNIGSPKKRNVYSTSSEIQMNKHFMNSGKIEFVKDVNKVVTFVGRNVRVLDYAKAGTVPKVVSNVNVNWNDSEDERNNVLKEVKYDLEKNVFVCASFEKVKEDGSIVSISRIPIKSLIKKKKMKRKNKINKLNLNQPELDLKMKHRRIQSARRKQKTYKRTVSSMGKEKYFKYDCYRIRNKKGQILAYGVLKDIHFDWKMESYIGTFSSSEIFKVKDSRINRKKREIIIDLRLCKKVRRERI